MKIKVTAEGTMAEVRMKDRRIKVVRLKDKNWGVAFVRPVKACEGCPESFNHKVFMDPKRRRVVTGMQLSHEAMTGLMNAVLTLIEAEIWNNSLTVGGTPYRAGTGSALDFSEGVRA